MQNSITDTILERTSIRSYESRELSNSLLESILDILNFSGKGLLGSTVNFDLVYKYSAENQKLKLGTYGFITGARYFIVGQMLPGKEAYLDYGFLMEKIILEITKLKLGTCWLGGTFDRGEFSKSIKLDDHAVIPAICPVGHSTSRRSIGDRLVRFSAGSKNRKARESLFFDQEPGNPLLFDQLDENSATMLEMVRMAPSASNIQPWRIIFGDDQYHIYLERKTGYQKVFGKVDLQMIDIGISMCHFELTARGFGKNPEWKILDNKNIIEGWEYVISVKL